MMEVYFDNAASTRALPEAVERMADILLHAYANPAALSKKGMEAEDLIIAARREIAGFIGAGETEIYFTSGGTEGDNWAVFGTAAGYRRNGMHIVTTKAEHPAVSAPFQVLEEQGFSVTYLETDSKGRISLTELADAVTKETILVSCIYISNETGTVQPIAEMGRIIKEKNPNTLFHVDAVQAFGKYKIHVGRDRIDMLSASGHKFHAPKGTGFFYLRRGTLVKPLLYGGGHQRGMRAGTENTAGAAALSLAAKEAYRDLEAHTENVLAVKKHLYEGICRLYPSARLNGEGLLEASPYVLNVSFPGLKSEVLLHALEEKGVYVSAGSACNSKKTHVSPALLAMGLSKEELEGAIRFSFSRFSTIEEANACLEALGQVIPFLMRARTRR